MYLSLYCKGSKRLFKVLLWDGVGERTELQYFDPHSYGRQRCVFLILLMLNRRPGGSICWLSLLHLINNFSGPRLTRAPRAPFTGLSLPHLVFKLVESPTPDFLSWLSYIIVQRPLNRPLNPWNGMFDRYQAEITIMLFTGHSLPVHHSMSVPWDFFFTLSHFISQIPPTRFLSITDHWDVSLPSGASLWNDIFGRVEGQNTTYPPSFLYANR